MSGYLPMSCAAVSLRRGVAWDREGSASAPMPKGCTRNTQRLGGDGAALLGDDRVGLVVGTALAGIAAINVRPELGDAVAAGEGREIEEMHPPRSRELHVDLLAAVGLRLPLFQRPALLIAE